jgi:kynurenine formamidase
VSASEALSVNITHQDHKELAQSLADFLGCTVNDFPEGLGYANDEVTINAHTGTHLDAPWHYYPTSKGVRAKTIDEIPLEWCIGNGVVIDVRHKPEGSLITVEDLEAALAKINYQISEGDIVFIQTGADKYWGTKEYFDKGCGMGYESTIWLIDQGSRVMGIDAWGWDRPFWAIKEEFQKTGNREILWGAHRAGRDREYCHIEKLANLDTLPKPFGFTACCFPVKLVGGSAGWCRAVAWFDKE